MRVRLLHGSVARPCRRILCVWVSASTVVVGCFMLSAYRPEYIEEFDVFLAYTVRDAIRLETMWQVRCVC